MRHSQLYFLPCSLPKQVESQHNHGLLMEYLASFAHDLPCAADVKARSLFIMVNGNEIIEIVIQLIIEP